MEIDSTDSALPSTAGESKASNTTPSTPPVPNTSATPTPASAVVSVAEKEKDKEKKKLQRFQNVPAHPPKAYFCLAGKQFVTYCNELAVQLGRSPDPIGTPIQGNNNESSTIPVVSLGEEKTVSRNHMLLSWEKTTQKWAIRVFGKNGFYFNGRKYEPTKHEMSLASTSKADIEGIQSKMAPHLELSSRRASVIRIGQGELMFYFVPALDPNSSEAADVVAANAVTAAANGSNPSTSASKKKKSSSPAAPTSTAAPGGESPNNKSSKKKKRPLESAGATESKGASNADDAEEDEPLTKRKKKNITAALNTGTTNVKLPTSTAPVRAATVTHVIEDSRESLKLQQERELVESSQPGVKDE